MKRIINYIFILISIIIGSEKIDINNSNELELKQLPLTNEQLKSLIEFRRLHGEIKNIYELKNIDFFNIEKVHELKAHIEIKKIINQSNDLEKNYSYKVSQWLSSNGSSENLSESWLDRYFQPRNINNMNYDDLMSLPNLSPLDVVAILKQKEISPLNILILIFFFLSIAYSFLYTRF